MKKVIEEQRKEIEATFYGEWDKELQSISEKVWDTAVSLEEVCLKSGRAVPKTLFYDHYLLRYGEWLEEKLDDQRRLSICGQYAFEDDNKAKNIYDEFKRVFDLFIEKIDVLGRDSYSKFIAFIKDGSIPPASVKKEKGRRRSRTETRKKQNDSDENGKKPQSVSELNRVKNKRQYMQEVREGISRCKMLEGLEDENLFRTYEDLKTENAFLNLKLKSGREMITSAELIERDWFEAKWGCRVITGGVGYGKSLLLHRIAEHLMEQHEGGLRNEMIIFVSQWNWEELNGRKGEAYFRRFLKKELPKRWKMVVIVDGLDELMARGLFTSIDKMLDACKYYKASLIINCRSSLFNEIRKRNSPVVTACWELKGVEKEELLPVAEPLLERKTLSEKTVWGLLEIPYFWMLMKCQPMDENALFLNNDYRFLEKMYHCLEQRERQKYQLPSEYFKDLQEALKGTALAQWEYGGQNVSLQACRDWSGLSGERYEELVETTFFKELVHVDLEAGQETLRGIVRGFKDPIFGEYFAAYGFREVLRGKPEGIRELLKKGAFSREQMLLLACCTKLMAADEKKKIRGTLQELAKEDTDTPEFCTSCRELLEVLA